MGRQQIDLFGLASSTHLPLWYSWAYYPEAITPHVILQPWTRLSLYAFPHSCCYPKRGEDMGRRGEGGEGGGGDNLSLHMAEEVLVHPLASDGMRVPCLSPLSVDLLLQSLLVRDMLFYLDVRTLRLAALYLSGRHSSMLDFSRRHRHGTCVHHTNIMAGL